MRNKLIVIMVALLGATALVTSGCTESDADVAATNISKAAEQFEVPRRIVAVNGITDKYLLEVEGFCSVETVDSGLDGAASITCKVGNHQFKKSYVYLSDNVTFIIQQVDPIDVSTTHYRMIFKPETIIPDIDRP